MSNILKELEAVQEAVEAQVFPLQMLRTALHKAIVALQDQPLRPTPCAAVFVRAGATYLIGERRSKNTVSGVREPCIPGGKIDWMESTVTAAIREIYEETCLTLDPARVSYLGYADEIWEENGFHFVTHFFVADIDNDELLKLQEPEPTKIGGWKWMTKEEILQGPRMFASASDMAELLPDTTEHIMQSLVDEAQTLNMGY